VANYPKELAQDAAYQSHTGRLTALWFLPELTLGLNTNYLLLLYSVNTQTSEHYWGPE
jgi:hypothetical protein